VGEDGDTSILQCKHGIGAWTLRRTNRLPARQILGRQIYAGLSTARGEIHFYVAQPVIRRSTAAKAAYITTPITAIPIRPVTETGT
jgi:hypothetical protein